MRYDDASQASSANAEPIARADTEVLPQGSFGPATGNAISGAGTTSGANGADSVGAAPATIAAVQGAGGATGQAAGSFHALGQYGVLSMDAEGNFSYVRNPGTPDGVQDVFQYTLADAAGAQSSTTLTIDIAQVAAAQAGQGIVNLPAGVELSDIHVNGRDLVIDMPDGTQMVIPGGAVFVPQLAIGDVEVPATNLAALLINSEPQPAAGTPQSSGGNFAVDVPPLDPGVPLGDLIPPTELSYTPPEFEEPANAIDHKPTVIIITPDNPAGAVDAVANVDESGLPARGSEPEGTLASQDIESTSGTIVFVAEDGVDSITVGGVEVTAVNQVINGAHGVLTITSIDLATGQIGFSYTATDNTTDGVDDFEDFAVVVTDSDGDVASGNLHINIADDEPIALDDTDTLNADEQTADGNVMTGAGTTTGAAGHDTVGADNATLTAVSGADGSDSSFNDDGNLVVHGAYGTLSIDAEGNYTYVRDTGAPDNVSDVFEYTLTDGDGDIATATLTIIVPDLNEPPVVEGSAVNVSEEGLPGGNPDTSGTPDTTNSKTASGDIGLTDPDGDATTVTLGVPAGSYTSGGEAVHWAVSADGHSLVGYTGADSTTNHVIEVTINDAGEYTVNLVQPFDDPNVAIEDSIAFTVPVSVNDGTETVSTSITVTVEDDAPNAVNDTDSVSGNTAVGNVVTGVGTTNGGADSYGADGPGSVTGIHAGTSGSFTAVPQDGGDVLVHGSFGDLVIHDDGSYTYTRSPNSVAGGTDVFTYQLTDGDGDTDTATLTITVPNINTTPSIISADDTLVDEDGLPGANVDGTPLRPGETDSTESATDTGQIVVDYKSDVPANLLNAITLVDDGSLDGQLQTTDGKDIVFALEGGQLVGRPDGGGDPLVVISITGAVAGSGGEVTYTYQVQLLGPVEHPVAGVEDSIQLTGVDFQITDSNGDHASGNFDVTIVDDLPLAVQPPENPQDPEGPPLPIISGSVDEDDLPSGNNDLADGDDLPIDSSTIVSGAAGSLAALFDAGADSPMQNYGLGSTADLPALTSNGHAVVYEVDGDTLTATADIDGNGTIGDGETIFTLTVNADGSWSFELQGQLDHPVIGTEDNLLLDLSSVITAEDADGDPVTAADGAFVINVDDDMPQPFDEGNCPQVTAINAPGDESDPISLNLPDIGADQPATFTFGYVDQETGLPVLVADGDPVLNTDGDPLTSGGSALHYEVNGDVLQAVTEGGDPVFEIDLNPDGTFTYQQFSAIDNGSGSVSFDDLAGTNAGNADFQGVGADDPATTVDLLISAEKDGADATVNTDHDSIGSANQSMDDGETVRVDFVQNLQDNDDPSAPSGFNYGAHVSTNTFTGEIPQVQGEQGETVAFTVWALDSTNTDTVEPDRDPSGGFDDANVTAVTEVTVKDYDTGASTTVDVTGFTEGVFTDVAYGISVRVNADGSVTFSGIQEGDSYGISTGSGSFNAVAVQAEPTGTGPGDGSTQNSFDLGVFSIGSVDSGEPVDLSVPILVTDADGDPVSCDIDITLNPGTSVANASGTVNEAALDDVGSNPGSNAETVTIDLAASVGGTGPFTFALSGDADHDGTVEGAYGTITLNPDGHTVTYTLMDPVDGPGADDGANPISGLENFDFEVTDGNGDTSTSMVKITIIDDVPMATADTNSVNEGDSVNGNVLTDGVDDVFGADGAAPGGGVTGVATGSDTSAAVTGNVGTEITGDYGKLTLNADGTYTYVADANAIGSDQTDHFVYTITDGDGDTSTVTLDINVDDVSLSGDDDSVTVDEAALSTGSDPLSTAEAASGQVVVAGATSYELVDSGTGSHGTLVLNNDGTYTYTLTSPVDGTTADNSTNTVTGVESFTYKATDADGNETTGTITVDVKDDVPTAHADTNSVTEGGSASGNVLTDGVDDVFGADGQAPGGGITGVEHGTDTSNPVSGNVGTEITGDYGKLTLNADGTYTYVADANAVTADQTDHFVYTITDGDGDTSTVTLDINVDDVSLSGDDDSVTVDEAALATGSNPLSTAEAASGQVVVAGATSYELVDSGTGSHGTLVLNNDGTYTYTLTSPVDGTTADNSTNTVTGIESFTYKATDADGNETTGTITVDVKDDVPTAHADTNSVTEGGSTSGNVLTDGIDDVFGADGQAPGSGITGVEHGTDTSSPVSGNVGTEIAGDYGKLTLNADGSYDYVSTDGAVPQGGATDTFVYTITDGDGDTSTVTLTITLNNDNLIPVAGEANAAVDDEGLQYGIAGGDGDIDADTDDSGAGLGDEAVFVGQLQGSGGDTPTTFLFDAALDGTTDTLGTETIKYGVSLDGLTLTATVDGGDRDGTELFTVVIDNASTGAYTLTLENPVMHTYGDGDETSVTLDIPYQMQDSDTPGDMSASPGTLHVEFNDDTPVTFAPDAAELENDSGTITGVTLDLDDGDLTDNVGADQPGTVRFAVTEGANSGLTSNGAAILYHLSADGQTLYGYVDDGTNSGFQGAEDDTIFTIVLNQGDSTYDVTMDGHVDSKSTIDFNDGSYDFVGGNDPWAGFVPNGEIDGKAHNTPVANLSEDLLLTPYSTTGEGDAINGTANSAGTTGGGAGQNVGTGEGIRLDFVHDLVGNPAGTPADYDEDQTQQDHDFTDHYDVNDVSVKFGDGNTNTTINIKIFDNVDNPDDYVLNEGDLVNITKITINYDGEAQEFTFDPLHPTTAQTKTVGDGDNLDGLSDRSYTVQWVQDGTGLYHVKVTGILDTNVRIATHGETDYEALQIQYMSGDDFELTGFGAVAETTDPVTFHVPVELADADGDTVAGDTLDITLDPVGSLNSLSTLSVQSNSLTTQGFKTALAPSNDNSGSNSNTALLGAVAAAGLVASQDAAAHHNVDHAAVHEARIEARAADHAQTLSVSARHDAGGRGGERIDRGDSSHHDAVLSKTAAVHDEVLSQHAGNDHHQQNAPAALLQGTSAPVHGHEGGHAAVIAAAVAMPSAEQLAAVAGKGGDGQHNEVVGKVLADALQGGEGHGPNLEALINSLPAHGHGPALAALASHAEGHVPHGHTAFAGVFSTGHNMLTMDHMAAHHDAPPPHA